ncbi:MAG: fused MFS/spermidine synthase [Anaerolineae bacterium]|nr:fused MFS/spermidine synthase [Anaerolineae bacterium]
MPSRRFLIFTVFTSGMATLAIEVTASRLLQTTFGTSNLIWANIIGLMLVYLTVGYFIGGRLADRYPRPLPFYRLVAWGAFLAGLVPMIADPVIKAASVAVYSFQAGAAVAAFASTLALFSIPVILLGCVSPFAIRLAVTDPQTAGSISGQIYGISTLGSIVGTFLPSLLLFDLIGVRPTFLLFAGILLIVALIGVATRRRRAVLPLIWMPIVLLILALLTFAGPIRAARPGTTLLYEKDSAYNFIQVVQLDGNAGIFSKGTHWLLLNEGAGIHSAWNPEGDIYVQTQNGAAPSTGTWDLFLAAPYFNPDYSADEVKSLCVVGLAGGTISTQYSDVFGEDVLIDGIEIDPAIVEAGKQYFGMTQPNLNIIVEDGRVGLEQSEKRYDVIGIDAYRVPYVPWHLTTQEFFRIVRDHLTDRGVLAINVGRAVNTTAGSDDRRLVEAMTNTLLKVFPTVHTIDVPNSFNTILVATMMPTTSQALLKNFDALPADSSPLLKTAMQVAINALKPTMRSDVLFTDDRAPVETIINSILLDFILGGGTQQFGG